MKQLAYDERNTYIIFRVELGRNANGLRKNEAIWLERPYNKFFKIVQITN